MTCLIATPVRGGSTDILYTVGLMQSNGLFGGWMPMMGQSDIYMARNTLAYEFLNTSHDHLIFIDSDIGFSRQNFIDLLDTAEPFVSGLYPDKVADEWVFRGTDGKVVPLDKIPEKGLMKARFVPCGFLKADRRVFEAIIEQGLAEPFGDAHPERKDSVRAHQFFRGLIVENRLLSEDYSFSHLVAQAGFQPYVNCGIRLTHGSKTL